MPRKDPIYYKKSKAAKQFELEDDFHSESESFLRQFEKEPGRNKLKTQNAKQQHKYKRIDYFPSYDDRYNERKRHNYDTDIYFESDYTYDTGGKYFDYISEGPDYSDTELSFDQSHQKRKKERQNIPYEKSDYNHIKKQKDDKNNFRKHKNPALIYNSDRIIRDEKDFNVYISQQPITFPYKSQDDQTEPLESKTQRRSKSKEHKGLKIPTSDSKLPGNYQVYRTELRTNPPNTVFGQQQHGDSPHMHSTLTDFPKIASQLTRNISQNSDQSTLQLVYLPVFVMNNNNNSQSAGNIQPVLLDNNTNYSPNTMTVLAALNTDQNNIFEQKNQSVNKEKEVSIQTKKSKENVRKNKASGIKQKEAELLKKKLFTSNLGAAMTAESYANLIVSHPEHSHNPGNALPCLLRLTKSLKNKKSASLTTLSANSSREIAVVDPYPTEENPQAITEEDKSKGNERKLSSISKESLSRGINNNKQTAKEGKKSSHMRNAQLGQMGEDQNIVINIKEHSVMSNVLPTATQAKEKETNLNSRVTERQSIVSRNPELSDTKRKEFMNIKNGQQSIRGNRYPLQTQTKEKETNLNSRVTEQQSVGSRKPELSDIKRKESMNIKNGQQSIRDNRYPPRTQTKEKETNLNNRVTEQQSIGSRKTELSDIKGKGSMNIKNGQQSIRDNRYPPQNHSNVDEKTSLGSKNYSKASEVMTGNYKKVGPNQNSLNTLKTLAIAEGERSSVKGPTSDNGKNINEFKNKNTDKNKKTDSNNIKPIDIAKTEKGKMSLAKQDKYLTTIDGKSNFVAQDKDFTREISLNELEESSAANIQNGEEVEKLNNPKGILRKEILNKAREIKEENRQQIQQENENLEINDEQTDENVQSVREDQGGKCSIGGKTSLKIIHAPDEKKSSMVQSTHSSSSLRSEELGESSHGNPSQLMEYTEVFLIVSFKIAQYIVGVSCFDKLIHVIDSFSYEDDK